MDDEVKWVYCCPGAAVYLFLHTGVDVEFMVYWDCYSFRLRFALI